MANELLILFTGFMLGMTLMMIIDSVTILKGK